MCFGKNIFLFFGKFDTVCVGFFVLILFDGKLLNIDGKIILNWVDIEERGYVWVQKGFEDVAMVLKLQAI